MNMENIESIKMHWGLNALILDNLVSMGSYWFMCNHKLQTSIDGAGILGNHIDPEENGNSDSGCLLVV